MSKRRQNNIAAISRYAKSRIGYGAKPNQSIFDLVCQALEMDGMPLPMDITARSWVKSNMDYIVIEAKKVSAKLKKMEVPDPSSLPKPKQVGSYAENKKKKTSVASDSFLSTYEWRKVRMQALKKYGPVCQCCGATPATGAVMNVDHIKPRKLFPSLALDVNNLQVLCHECNHGKGNWDQTDWRK